MALCNTPNSYWIRHSSRIFSNIILLGTLKKKVLCLVITIKKLKSFIRDTKTLNRCWINSNNIFRNLSVPILNELILPVLLIICVRPRGNQVKVARTETEIVSSRVKKSVLGFRHACYKKWDSEASNRDNHSK